ncbi:serine hydrolase domain-containing protein [Priestia megaterium]|uniref:serine hydrolase domain-containing protein n=1 Tax=Priestia megaterium TaxID=1404 RepID=UPI00207971DA|nr:serine hydrolase domain-containing protein [Priestia megaterium]USL27526.1 beta-lactamase family protein [Priestia megaterium]USL33435.1 beta-lactamase family protein [Priestia megaterium]USL39367.1 beta-lactamase family protein [Priestia megaterium]WDM31527.1 beta-lactamase family protein [Priestia megaterium]
MQPITKNEMKVFPPYKEDIVTKDNWFTSQKNLQRYCHSGDLSPSRIIWRGNQNPTQLSYTKDQLNLEKIKDKNAESVLSYLERTNTDAFLVMYQGKVMYENYFNGYKSYQPHAMNSATKSFVGLIVNLLADEGLLDINKKSSFYIPELDGTGLGDGTVQQLLDMQVPVKYLEADTPLGIGRGTPIFMATGSIPKPDNYDGPENLYDFMTSSKKDKIPGTAFYYENGQTEALGWIVKRLTGKNLAELIQEIIWSKLGTEENALMQLDLIGTDIASGGMRATLRDLARFGEMMLNDGYYNGQQIIPGHIIREIKKGGNRKYLAESNHSHLSGFSYHNQWWVSHDQFGGYSARGKFDQQIYIAPKADTVILKLSSYQSPISEKANAFQAIIDYLVKQ